MTTAARSTSDHGAPAAAPGTSTGTVCLLSGMTEDEARASYLQVLDGWAQQRVPYLWGGKALPPGLDCSGAACHGLEVLGLVPRGWGRDHNADSLYHLCQSLAPAAAQPGDLVFYTTHSTASWITHVMVLADAERVVGASGGGSHCTSVERARQIGACVQYHDRATYRPQDVAGHGRLPYWPRALP